MKCILSLVIQSLRPLWNCLKPISIALLAIALVITCAFMPTALASSGHRHRMMMHDSSIEDDQCCHSSMEDTEEFYESSHPDIRHSNQRRSPSRSMQRMQRWTDLETIEGTITEVRSPDFHPLAPVTLMLQVFEDTTPNPDSATPDPIEILVAPRWYLTEQQINFAPGETITVTGLPQNFDLDHSPLDTLEFFQAFTIQRSDVEIRLRSDRGFPRWQDSLSSSSRLKVYAASSTSLYH